MDREPTFGEKAVGVSFNPSQDEGVKELKALYAKIIDHLQVDRKTAEEMKDFERVRLYSVAITEAQTAQMWAVKARTWGL